MPLNGYGKALCVLHPERLDHTIRRARLDGEAPPEPLDPLPVERVDAYALGADQAAQQSPGLQCHLGRRAVLRLQRLRRIVAVTARPRPLAQPLTPGAAAGGVDLLAPA